ncbi:MAG: hypothetical protein CMK59_05255 [Proteobacteria bacterium]|nr:hypothetical protein [Pseudomonadota bacterium]
MDLLVTKRFSHAQKIKNKSYKLVFERRIPKTVRQFSPLMGLHSIKFPFIALSTQRTMGHSIHVLSQKNVAGQMFPSKAWNPQKETK